MYNPLKRSLSRLKRVLFILSTACVLLLPFVANSTVLVVRPDDESSWSRQKTLEEKEQWNDTRSLRHKVNQRAETQWDKDSAAYDSEEKCEKSSNVNAYWEPDTQRCLDRHTGRALTP